MILTHDRLLDGRVAYVQPAQGFRSGIEPMLLAAAVPARPGERVLEAGCGPGAALLCLTARVPGVRGLGVERDPMLVALAQQNAAANGADGLTFLAADITAMPEQGVFDHAMANPPYHDPGGTASPLPARVQAKQAGPGMLAAWAQAMGAMLRHRGTLTFVLPAASLPACLTAMSAARCPAVSVLPLWPRAGRAAKLLLVRGVKDGRSPLRLLAGLALHDDDGGYTAAATRILREGGGLDIQSRAK